MAALHKIILILTISTFINLINAQNLCKIYHDESKYYTMVCGIKDNLTEIPSMIDPSIEVSYLLDGIFI